MGPNVERAIGAAIAYQIMDGLPFDEISKIGVAGVSSMFLSDFILKYSAPMIKNSVKGATNAVISFVNPMPKTMKLYFATY